MSDESKELNEIKVLLAQISGEINLSEEIVANKATKLEVVEKLNALESKVFTAIRRVDGRINGLYIKIAGASGIIVGIVELIARII